MQLKETDILISIIAISIFIFSILVFFFIVLFRNYKHHLKRHNFNINLIYRTEERERKRIAVDLHDNIGAHLSIIKLHASGIQNDKDINSAKNIANKISMNADESISNLRLILRNLIPSKIEQNGWISELNDFINVINVKNNDYIRLNVISSIPRFKIENEILLYRILQELLNNAIKHSQATAIEVVIYSNGSQLCISVKDNGIGFMDVNNNNGYGLKNIITRVKTINGKIEKDDSCEMGTIFNLTFNLILL